MKHFFKTIVHCALCIVNRLTTCAFIGSRTVVETTVKQSCKYLALLLTLLLSVNMWGAETIASGTYVLCTSTNDLKAGDHYIIASGTSGDVKCISSESNNNNRKVVAATVSSSKITVASTSTSTPTIMTLTLGGSTGAWTFQTDNYAGGNGYLASAASGSNNYCRVISDATAATISFSDNAAVITLNPHTSRNILRYNSSASCFACYSSGQAAVYLYKKEAAATPYTVTFNGNGHGNPASFSLTESSAGAGVTLPSCTPTSDDYVFAGWATTQAKANAGTVDAGAANATYKPSDEITLYAVYKYNVKWSVNGTIKETVAYTHGSNLALPTITPVTSDCDGSKVFVGWTTGQISTPTDTKPTMFTTASGTVTAPVTYYAVFATESSGGGSVTKSYGWETAMSSTDWEISNLDNGGSYNSYKHAGSYAGSTTGKETASIQTKSKIASPTSATCYYTKATSNTNSSSYFVIQVSTDGSQWIDVEKGKTMNNVTQGTFEELTADLSSYSNVYVRFYYKGTTAVRVLDDVSVIYGGGTSYSAYITSCRSLTSISVKTNPTTTSFTKGDAFSASGLVITEHYDNGDNVDVTYAGNESAFSFAGYNMGTEGNYTVTITYKGQTTTYNINVAAPTACKTPTFSVAAGTYTGTQSVSLSCQTDGATIYYTTDGSDPTTSGAKQTYSAAINVNHDMTIKAYATKNGLVDSDPVSAAYVIQYAVTFDMKGHGTAPSTITNAKYNQTITAPTEPSVTGYTFGGWFKETDCTNEWNFATDKVTENITLFAKWTEKKFDVVLFNNGNQVGETLHIQEGATLGELPTLDASASCDPHSKTFVGWMIGTIDGKQQSAPTLFSASTPVTEPMTLNAVWAEETVVPSTTYSKITSESDLTEGNYVIAYKHTSNATQIALKNETASNNHLAASNVSLSDQQYKNPNEDYIWELQGNATDGFALYNADVEKYVSATSEGVSLVSTNGTIFHPVYDTSNSSWRWAIPGATGYYFCGYVNGSTYYFQASTSGGGSGYMVYLYKQGTTTGRKNYLTTCSTAPLIEVSTTELSGFSTIATTNNPSAAQSFTVEGYNLTENISVSAPTGYEVSLAQASDYSASVQLPQAGGTVYVRLAAADDADDEVTGSISITSAGATEKNIALTGMVVAKMLNSISVATDPKTKYTLGDTFDPTGLVITATYNSGNEEISYADHASDFSFSPDLTTPLTASNNQVTITFGGKTTTVNLSYQCSVAWMVNGSEWADKGGSTMIAYNSVATAPTTAPTAADCDDEKVFVGWTATETYESATDAPSDLFTTTSTALTANTTFYAVFANASEGGAPALTKMVSGNILEDGDKIVIVAHETTVAMYQETVNSSYVNLWTFDNNITTVLDDNKNWLTINAEDDGFSLGDATNGYIYSSNNNLYCGEIEQVWTLSDLEDGTFKMQSDDRNLSYRSDLSSQYWRMGGANYGISGQTVLDIYKITGGGISYSNYLTTCATTATVQFDMQGHGTQAATLTEQTVGTEITSLPAVTDVEGYTFLGWSETAGGAVITSFTPAKPKTYTLYAIWQTNTHSLTWTTDGDELTGDYTHGDAVAYGTSIDAPTATKTGYTFKDWTSEVPATMPDNDLSFTATWTINSYTLTWNFAGGETSSDNYTQGSVEYNAAITYPADNTMSRDGFAFKGWDKTITNMPAEATTITAIWAPVIVIDPTTPTPVICYQDEDASLTIMATVGEGTLSYQWQSSANGTDGWNDIANATNETYYPSTTSIGVTYYHCVVTSNLGLTATSLPATVTVNQKQSNKYTITYAYKDWSTDPGKQVLDVEGGSEVTLPTLESLDMTKEGYTFSKWQMPDGTFQQPDETFTMPTENIVISAVLEEIQQNITYNVNGSAASQLNWTSQPATVNYWGDDLTAEYTITPGYHVSAAAVTVNGVALTAGEIEVNDEYESIVITPAAKKFDGAVSVTLTVEPMQYTVYLSADGATNTYTTQVEATFGAAMPTPITLPIKPGYTFLGYSYTDQETSITTQYYSSTGASAHTWDIPAGATLYAQWSTVSYGITYTETTNLTWGENPATINIETDMLTANYTVTAGYEVTGMTVTVGGNAVAASDIVYNQTHVDIMTTFSGAVVIIPTVTPIHYTITYLKNDGSASSSTQEAVYMENVTLRDGATFKRKGYTIDHWATEDELTTYVKGYTFEPYNLTSDLTLKAIWTVKESDWYTITFVDQLQDSEVAPISGIKEVDAFTFPTLEDRETPPDDTGQCNVQHYHFMGWIAEDDKDNEITESNIIKGGTVVSAASVPANAKYYAIWATATME